MEREYQLFCDRCGQRLNWSGFDDVEVRYIGWDGIEDDCLLVLLFYSTLIESARLYSDSPILCKLLTKANKLLFFIFHSGTGKNDLLASILAHIKPLQILRSEAQSKRNLYLQILFLPKTAYKGTKYNVLP